MPGPRPQPINLHCCCWGGCRCSNQRPCRSSCVLAACAGAYFHSGPQRSTIIYTTNSQQLKPSTLQMLPIPQRPLFYSTCLQTNSNFLNDHGEFRCHRRSWSWIQQGLSVDRLFLYHDMYASPAELKHVPKLCSPHCLIIKRYALFLAWETVYLTFSQVPFFEFCVYRGWIIYFVADKVTITLPFSEIPGVQLQTWTLKSTFSTIARSWFSVPWSHPL